MERVSLTPEGFAYTIVMLFITVGAVMRNVNLLILMAGLMLAPLFINWRLAVHRIRSLRGKRRLPVRIHAKQLTTIQWMCENSMSAIPAIDVMVKESLRRAPQEHQNTKIESGRGAFRSSKFLHRWFSEIFERLTPRSAPAGTAICLARFPRLEKGHVGVQGYQAYLATRGKYWIGPAEIYCLFPFGLIISRQRIGQETSFFVAPELGKLSPTWENRINSVAKGMESIRRNRAIEEDEFFALRPWRSGDSRKHIHWRSTARYGSPIVKQFVERANRDFAIVLDLHSDGDRASIAACESVLSFAATVLLGSNADVEGQVAVAVCGADYQSFTSRTLSAITAKCMPSLAVASASDNPEIGRGVVACMQAVSSSTPVYVISSRSAPPDLEGFLIDSIDISDSRRRTAKEPADADARQTYLQRRIHIAAPAVRWLDARSQEFSRIFELPSREGTAVERTADPLRRLSKKWSEHV